MYIYTYIYIHGYRVWVTDLWADEIQMCVLMFSLIVYIHRIQICVLIFVKYRCVCWYAICFSLHVHTHTHTHTYIHACINVYIWYRFVFWYSYRGCLCMFHPKKTRMLKYADVCWRMCHARETTRARAVGSATPDYWEVLFDYIHTYVLYTYIHTYIHTYTHTYVCTYRHTHTHSHTYPFNFF
jgi:hypothetical protein